MNIFKIGLVFLVCIALANCQESEEPVENPDVNDTENDTPPETSPETPEDKPELQPEPSTPSSESSENSTSTTESPSKDEAELTIITISREPQTPRCLLCNLLSRGFQRSPFGSSGNYPTFSRVPSPRYPPPLYRNPTENTFRLFTFKDPLANYTRPQRFRQLMQDMIGLELMRFEKMIDQQMEITEDSAERTGLQNVLNGLKQFQQVLKDNQLFNFMEIMRNHNSGNDEGSEPSDESAGDDNRHRFRPSEENPDDLYK